jgi:hypothetical protein
MFPATPGALRHDDLPEEHADGEGRRRQQKPGEVPVNIRNGPQHCELSYIGERGKAPRRPGRNADAIQPEFRGPLGHEVEGEDGRRNNEQEPQVSC